MKDVNQFYEQFFGVIPRENGTTINPSVLKFAKAYADKKIREFRCEYGEHDLIPVIDGENSPIGEVCRICGKLIKNKEK